jgi:hypothetical protein
MDQEAVLAARRERRLNEARVTLSLCAIAACGILICDLLTYRFNPSILYLVLLALVGRSGSKSAVWAIVLFSVPATYAGHFLGARDPQYRTFEQLFHLASSLNRTFVAMSLIAVASLFSLQRGMQSMVRRRGADQGDVEIAQILDGLDQAAAIVIALVVAAAVWLTDLVTPGNLNLPILFVIPMAFVSKVHSRKLLWGLAIFLVILAALAFKVGQQVYGNPALMRAVVTNRVLACVGILAIAAILHPLSRRPSRTLE